MGLDWLMEAQVQLLMEMHWLFTLVLHLVNKLIYRTVFAAGNQ